MLRLKMDHTVVRWQTFSNLLKSGVLNCLTYLPIWSDHLHCPPLETISQHNAAQTMFYHWDDVFRVIERVTFLPNLWSHLTRGPSNSDLLVDTPRTWDVGPCRDSNVNVVHLASFLINTRPERPFSLGQMSMSWKVSGVQCFFNVLILHWTVLCAIFLTCLLPFLACQLLTYYNFILNLSTVFLYLNCLSKNVHWQASESLTKQIFTQSHLLYTKMKTVLNRWFLKEIFTLIIFVEYHSKNDKSRMHVKTEQFCNILLCFLYFILVLFWVALLHKSYKIPLECVFAIRQNGKGSSVCMLLQFTE